MSKPKHTTEPPLDRIRRALLFADGGYIDGQVIVCGDALDATLELAAALREARAIVRRLVITCDIEDVDCATGETVGARLDRLAALLGEPEQQEAKP